MKRGNDTIKAMGQRRNLSRRKSLRTKKVKNEEINRTDRAKGKVTGNKGSEMRWRTGGIFEVAESHAEHATSPQHSLGAKGVFSRHDSEGGSVRRGGQYHLPGLSQARSVYITRQLDHSWVALENTLTRG